MAEKIIKNPSLLPSDLAFELSGNTITAISGHPIAGSGGGTVSDLVYYPVFDNSNGNVTFHLGTSAHGPEPGGAWHISGADGVDGISPKVRINSDNIWEVSEDGGTTWESTGVEATGPEGDKGDNGVSPTVSTSVIEGGNRVTFTYGAGQSESITVLNGTPGAAGASGYSPEITLEPATSVSYPNGGTKVTITDLEHQAGQEFYVWNGNDGQGATVNLLEGTGIKIEKVGQDYTIGVSGDYASTSDVEAASANAYNEAVAQIPDDYITKDVDNLTYYYKKTETSSTSELSTEFANKINKPDTSLTDKYLVLRTDTNGAVSGWCDYNDKIYSKSESDLRYMQKNTDSTLSGNGTTNSLLGINTTNMTANKQYAFTTNGWAEVSVPTIPDITANNGLSANGHTVGISTNNIDANKQYAWTTTGWQLVSVPTIPDITAHNGLSADGHTVGIDDTNIAANKQYAWTTTGWEEVDVPSTSDYLPLSGGTVSGQLVVSGDGTFDQENLKFIRSGLNGYGRIGLASNGALAFKVDDNNSNITQINVAANASYNELIQVQHGGTTAYLIPAQIHQGSYTPTADGILHIVLES